jgi:pimeloyl-ACP methyl ester carboxylesterase
MRARTLCARLLGLALALGVAQGAFALAPPPRVAEEVRFESEPGVVLAGTLERPAAAGKERLPVVLLVPGAGRWPRGGFTEIRARLLASGIATFQFDKRGIGKSTGAFDESLPAIERDARGAVRFLRTRPDIAPARIALLGHSQGAAAIPLVSATDPDVAAVVMLAGPIGPRGALFLAILRDNLAAGGKSPDEIDRITDAVGRWMESRSRGGDAGEVGGLRATAVAAFAGAGFPNGEAPVATLDTPVVLSMYGASIDEALMKTRAPVLAVYGTRDPVIAPAFSVAGAQRALRDNADAMVVAVPGLGHNLQRVDARGSGGGEMAESVSGLVSDWLRNRLRPPQPPGSK